MTIKTNPQGTANNRKLLCAAKPEVNGNSLQLTADGSVTIQAAAGDKKLPTFSMLAYTGGKMRTNFSRYPVVVDLAGMSIPSQNLPIRLQHDANRGVGHAETIKIDNGQVKATGVISRGTADAQEVVASGVNGFPWQSSIGAEVDKYEFVAEGQSARINGQSFEGPFMHIIKSTLNEISFVDLGADRKTSANVAASASGLVGKESNMDFEQWLKAKGFDPASLSEAQRASLKAAYDAEMKLEAGKTVTQLTVNANAQQPVENIDPVKAAREALALETERVAAIRAACNGKHAKLEAQAIRENWNIDRVNLEVLRAERPNVPNVVSLSAPQTTSTVVEAALAQAGKLSNLEKSFKAEDLEAAHKAFKGGLSLQQVLLHAAWANGYQGNVLNKGTIREVLHAAFSTISIPGILSNTANKFLLEGFMAVEAAWREIAAIRSVTDFKTNTRYRLTGAMQYQKVAPSGELKHGTISEESYTNKADTYGILFGASREDIINDDLGALTDMPRRIGRGGALKLNDVFWTAFMDNAAFFTDARGNYADGSTTAFGITGLTEIDTLFADQTDADGKPLGLLPAILLVPNALKVAAKQLVQSVELRDTTASTKTPVANPFAGQFKVVSSSYLGNSNYTGNSTKAWYLLANPAELPVVEVAFLNGQESPTVETADADFNQLGIQMRGYHDFGVALAEYRAGVKSKGEA